MVAKEVSGGGKPTEKDTFPYASGLEMWGSLRRANIKTAEGGRIPVILATQPPPLPGQALSVPYQRGGAPP